MAGAFGSRISPSLPSTRRRGSVLVEAMMSMSIITIVGLILLKLSLNILHPRQQILQETFSDAYMTYERAFAERVPFDELTGSASAWPQFPAVDSEQVEIGRLPGGRPVMATVNRTRVADTNNREESGGNGDEVTNPAGMETWRVQSVLTYQVDGRDYYKSRTVIRSQ